MAWNNRKNSTYYANTSAASDSGGSVGGTKSPGGSLGKTVQMVNDNPFSDTNTGATAGRYHPRRLYGRRGRTQGAQTQGGNFSGGGFSPGGKGGFNRLASGSWTGSGGGGPATPSIGGIFTGMSNPGSVY